MAKKKILIVDDEQDLLLVLGKRLTTEGYSVIVADNGYDALALAKSKSPDLIILDVVIPGMEGGEVAEKLKEDSITRKIPVIFLTALLRPEECQRNHVIAGNITFSKPVDVKVLLSQIERLLFSGHLLNADSVYIR
jgi:CheY-like chemotaxis protein